MATEFEKFDAVVRRVLSVPHAEIVRREKEWKKQRRKEQKKKRARASPASHASDGKD